LPCAFCFCHVARHARAASCRRATRKAPVWSTSTAAWCSECCRHPPAPERRRRQCQGNSRRFLSGSCAPCPVLVSGTSLWVSWASSARARSWLRFRYCMRVCLFSSVDIKSLYNLMHALLCTGQRYAFHCRASCVSHLPFDLSTIQWALFFTFGTIY
jgi:hypothetical protein